MSESRFAAGTKQGPSRLHPNRMSTGFAGLEMRTSSAGVLGSLGDMFADNPLDIAVDAMGAAAGAFGIGGAVAAAAGAEAFAYADLVVEANNLDGRADAATQKSPKAQPHAAAAKQHTSAARSHVQNGDGAKARAELDQALASVKAAETAAGMGFLGLPDSYWMIGAGVALFLVMTGGRISNPFRSRRRRRRRRR